MAAFPLSVCNVYDVKGRIALITGGGTGIGWMLAQGLAANGAKVYITGRRGEVLRAAAASFRATPDGGEIIPLILDITDRQSILNAHKVIQEREGRLHILINNAGDLGPLSPFLNRPNTPQHRSPETLGRALFENESFEEWAQTYATNSSAIFFMTTAFMGLLAKGSEDRDGYTSCVVNVLSAASFFKLAQCHFAYTSSKAASLHLTNMFASEFALKNIPVRVCGVAPGAFESEMTWEGMTAEDIDRIAGAVQPIPTRRAGTPQEIVGAVLFLVSPAGCYTNGQVILVDGGLLTVNPATV